MLNRLLVISVPFLLLSCFNPNKERAKIIERAYAYTQVAWQPAPHHVRHGLDSKGIVVHTPDVSLNQIAGFKGGYWKVNQPVKGMPYQWGGFDTPATFLAKIQQGYKAGDVGGAAKRKLGDAGVSKEACGIDCSGFVSRCWGLTKPYSTAEIPQIATALSSYDELLPGDILLLERKHVLIFNRWLDPQRKDLHAYEAGPLPYWRVSSSGMPINMLAQQGYQPWRFKKLN